MKSAPRILQSLKPLDQTEEIVFKEFPILNPDKFAQRLAPALSLNARRTVRRIRAICQSCLTGKHEKCKENGCPCVHRELQRSNLSND